MSGVLQSDWFVWGIGLILAFQVLVVMLGELLYRADRRELPISPILRAARNTVLPLAVIYLFVVKVLETPVDTIAARSIATALWISVLYSGLLLLNLLVFQQAPEGTWRYRAPSLFQDLLRMLLVAIGAAIVLAVVWQQNLGGLIAALGVGSIVLGLALQETLGNLMSGIALLFEKPFTIGDWIAVGDEQGEVVEINWRSVHLRTRERNLLVFPNAVLGREYITNYARPSALQTLRLSFAFSLEDPPNQVKKVLRQTAEELDLVLEDPPPRALARDVLDDRIRYEAFLFIDKPRQIPQIADEYTSKVWYAARRAGLELPLPAGYEIKLDDPRSRRGAVDVRGCLGKAQGFEVLADDDIKRLSDTAQVLMFADGETVIGEGTVADAVYVISSGSLQVTWAPEGEVVASLMLGPGEVIGVASLARQQASHTHITCDGDATLIRVPNDVVDTCLQKDARLAHEFARLFDVRAQALAQARDTHVANLKQVQDDEVLPVNMRRPQEEPGEGEVGQ